MDMKLSYLPYNLGLIGMGRAARELSWIARWIKIRSTYDVRGKHEKILPKIFAWISFDNIIALFLIEELCFRHFSGWADWGLLGKDDCRWVIFRIKSISNLQFNNTRKVSHTSRHRLEGWKSKQAKASKGWCYYAADVIRYNSMLYKIFD